MGPIPDGEDQGIGQILGWIRELQVAIERELEKQRYEILYGLSQANRMSTHSGVVEAEAIEGHLEVKIFVQLRHRGVYIELVIAASAIAVLVEEPVQEVGAQLSEAGGRDGVTTSSR